MRQRALIGTALTKSVSAFPVLAAGRKRAIHSLASTARLPGKKKFEESKRLSCSKSPQGIKSPGYLSIYYLEVVKRS